MVTTRESIHQDPELIRTIEELALQGFGEARRLQFSSQPLYAALRRAGSELWLDTGDREAAAAVWAEELKGLTTNNTLVNQVVQTGALDSLIKDATHKVRKAAPQITPDELVIELALLANARIALGLVEAFGAKVSVELHPNVADSVSQTIALARRYYRICPRHFIVKVPLTPDGYVSTRQLIREGIPINFTLGFSARQNYLATAFSRPRFVNVFLGRLNQVVSENGLGDGKYVGEKATLASQQVVNEIRGRKPEVRTRQIAASMRAGEQVVTLAGVDVLTMPTKVAREFLDSARDPDSIRPALDRDFDVDLSGADDARRRGIHVLWEVPEEIRELAWSADAEADRIAEGRDLIALARRHGIRDLFHEWTAEERRALREKGKIPDLGRWDPEEIGLDALMSAAALESFAKDQNALDQRIRDLISEA